MKSSIGQPLKHQRPQFNGKTKQHWLADQLNWSRLSIFVVAASRQHDLSACGMGPKGGIPRGDKVWQIVNDILSNKKVEQ